MATVVEILGTAGGSYPSLVKECQGALGWVDLTRTVRVVVDGKGFDGICLLNPLKELALLNSSDSPIPITDLVIAPFQGRITGGELTEADLNKLEVFLNIVADERMKNPDGCGQVQTPNASAARILISRFFMRRQKGLSHGMKVIP